ncbi:Hypothetical protein A7982_09763 [Minicystis rosea]|nr:Hypothetical protein A7982_09763 [Minicystis rosea]
MRPIAFLLPFGVMACSALEPVPPPPQEILLRIAGDPGQPLKGATVQYNGKKVSESNAEGIAPLKLNGKDGEVYDLTITCPDGYLSPSKPLSVMLKRLADTTKKPEYDISCPPTTRTVVVAVRADNGANLPVLYLGREVARTDAAGAAHVMFKLKSDESFNLVLGTEGQDRLRPQNPTASFVVRERDDVFTFDQKFELEKKRPTGGGGRRGPQRIGK